MTTATSRRFPRAWRAGVAAMAAALGVALMTPAPAAEAQSVKQKHLLGSYKDWDAMRALYSDGSKVCFMVSQPDKWQASRKNVTRGDIYILVSHKPSLKIRDEVNIDVGYPLKDGSTVRATIDGKTSFEMFTQGDGAWNYDAKADSKMVQAMKRGLKLVVTGTSSRGTRTTDTYSLSGFTAAHNAISDACGM
ncbi:invasion associated locus B family protein [Rhodothalassium salexigens]|nr:invasion associated locus B family protein [Rhodothalassium salexigens]MBB4211069.1 invasion protein IalB [Rhodothalassium salexigens DSM 2132]MBK1637928.1 hypothetical protein [Rhodothalassium salexigens DSM 2132]